MESQFSEQSIIHQQECAIWLKDMGAFLVDEDGSSLRLHTSDITDITKARMTMSTHHTDGTDIKVARKLGARELMFHGSFGLKVGLIAEGSAEIYLNSSSKTSIWDSSPNIVILTEAGGQITDIDGNELSINPAMQSNENGIVATNGKNHLRTVATIKQIIDQIRPQ